MHLKMCETSFGSLANSPVQDWQAKAYCFFYSINCPEEGLFPYVIGCQCFQLRGENRSNERMNKKYSIIVCRLLLEDTENIQESRIAMSFEDQIRKKDPNAAVLSNVATLMIYHKITYSNSCSSLERCFPYTDSTDWSAAPSSFMLLRPACSYAVTAGSN